MKTVKKVLLASIFAFVAISCKNDKSISIDDKQAIEQEMTNKIVKNPQTASFEIEGMTCKIGCANLIEGKLNKLDGVTEAKVDFDTKTATVIYDAEKLNQDKLTKTVEAFAGGDLYKVSKVK